MFILLCFASWTAIAWIVFRWSELPSAARTWVARLAAVAGAVGLAIAPFLEGHRAQQVGPFIGGPNLYPAETVERSFAVIAVGIGAALLALAAVARWGLRLPGKGPVAQAVKLTLVLLLLRLYLEKLAVPLRVGVFFGIIFLIVPVAAHFGLEAAKAMSQKRFWSWMVAYALGIRVLVIVLMLLATHFHLGTHLDNSAVTRYTVFGTERVVEPGSWEQYRNLIVLPQLVLWTGLTLLAGLVVGWPTYLVASRRHGPGAVVAQGAP